MRRGLTWLIEQAELRLLNQGDPREFQGDPGPVPTRTAKAEGPSTEMYVTGTPSRCLQTQETSRASAGILS